MKSKLSAALLSTFLVLGFIGMTWAQGKPDGSKHYFRTLGWLGDFTDIYMTQVLPKLDASGAIVDSPDYHETAVVILSTGRSEMYSYQLDKPLYFIKHVGKGISIVATAQIENNIPLALLLFNKVDGQDKYKVRVMADDNSGFPGGSYRCLNYSSQEVIVNVSGNMGHLAKEQDSIFKAQPIPGGKLVEFQLSLLSGKRVYSNVFPYSASVRYLMFVVDDPDHPGSVMFLRLPDSALAATPPPTESNSNPL